MKIGNTRLADKVYLIAEVGNNHEGDFGLASTMVYMAAAAGADAQRREPAARRVATAATVKSELIDARRPTRQQWHMSRWGQRTGIDARYLQGRPGQTQIRRQHRAEQALRELRDNAQCGQPAPHNQIGICLGVPPSGVDLVTGGLRRQRVDVQLGVSELTELHAHRLRDHELD